MTGRLLQDAPPDRCDALLELGDGKRGCADVGACAAALVTVVAEAVIGIGMTEAELDDAELDAVAGGGAWCYVIGGSDAGEDTWACTTWDNGAGACEYVGISLMWNDYD